jgi:hypothetical protein
MISLLKDRKSDKAEYLGQMLSMWGAAAWEIIEPEALLQDKNPIVIVPSGVEPRTDLIKSRLKEGSHFIFITPSRELLKEMGIDYLIQYGDPDRIGYIRQVRPLLGTFSWYAIPIVGRRMLSTEKHYSNPDHQVRLPAEARVWAYMYEMESENIDRPAVWTMPVGGGKITVFAYDLVECFRDLRQGRPKFADWRPAYDDICRASHLVGPDWETDFHGAQLPLADFHPMLLVRLIEQEIDIPLPRFWQLPGFAQSAILVSGDEDNGDPQYNEDICSFLDTIDGHILIYIEMQGTQTTPEQIRQWMDRGHSFSVHPYPVLKGESGLAPSGDVLKKLEACVEEFKKRYQLPIRTIRNHRVFWKGYTEVPRLWERLGIEMDCDYNREGSLAGRSLAGCFLTPPGALPISFLDEHFSKIKVLQQPCHFGDGSINAEGTREERYTAEFFETFADSLISHALKPLGIPFSVCFHPINYHRYAEKAEQRFLLKAKSLGAILISDYDWVDFWQRRASWRLVDYHRSNSQVHFKFAGNKPSKQLSISLPESYNDEQVCEISIDGKKLEVAPVSHFGMKRILIGLPDGCTEIEMTVSLRKESDHVGR